MIGSLGAYVRTRNSFAPYLSLISLKYSKSGSPSINNVSDEASNLKSFEKYPKKASNMIRLKNTNLGFLRIILL